jgi:PDZ domain
MSIVNLSVLVAISSFAHDLDFRGVQLGDSCEKAAERELALKAAPVLPVDQMLQTGILGFDDASTPDEPKRILYGCEEGHIDRYSISTSTHDEARAREIYTGTKSEFQARFGRPTIDSDTFNTFQQKRLAAIYTSEMSRWEMNDKTLFVELGIPLKKGEWNVTIRVGKAFHRGESAEGKRAVDAGRNVAEDTKPSRCEERAVLLNMVVSTSSGAPHWGWRVYPGPDADGFRRMGFSPGDFIWEIDGRPISTDDDFFHLLHEAAAGKPVLLSLQRSGSLQQLKVEPATAAAALQGCE